jgi:hypothetical protein
MLNPGRHSGSCRILRSSICNIRFNNSLYELIWTVFDRIITFLYNIHVQHSRGTLFLGYVNIDGVFSLLLQIKTLRKSVKIFQG